mmetsp:Transcript_21419/g.59474  ORF Transcript_21419/g.59474 Transcript_21419/m.59474 type:complete len:256 (+) Transcript_21419:256-1023(+)
MGLSFSELVVILGAGVAILGTKDISRGMRSAGLLAGRAVGFLFQARSAAYKYAQEAQLVELHKEVTHGVQQLDAVRRDLNSGVRFFSNPVTFASSSMMGSGQVGSGLQTKTTTPIASSSAGSSGPNLGGSSNSYPKMAYPSPPPPPKQQQQARQFPEPHIQVPSHPAPMNSGADGHGLPMIPVSAVAAGRAPKWDDRVPTGSDILLDALMEQKVAMHAKSFLESQESPGHADPAAAAPHASNHRTAESHGNGHSP